MQDWANNRLPIYRPEKLTSSEEKPLQTVKIDYWLVLPNLQLLSMLRPRPLTMIYHQDAASQMFSYIPI